MTHNTREVLGEAAYIRRTVEILLDRIGDVERAVSGGENLTAKQEQEMQRANGAWADGIKDQVELATRFADEWCREVLTIVERIR